MPDPTTVFLVRHGQTDWVAKGIPGRLPDVPLNADGREQAARLAARMGHLPQRPIYSSPLERTRETAAPLARHSASISSVRFYDDALQILGVNDTGDIYA